tara:strand:+ start:258 stop:518 length:261 start_codon:yes stop_codon:yes gene_type:complete
MTQNEMIEQFKKQLEEVVTKIKELDQELNLKKEEYFKLTGAVQALELAAKESESSTEGGTIADTTPTPPPADGMVPPQVTSKGVIQ